MGMHIFRHLLALALVWAFAVAPAQSVERAHLDMDGAWAAVAASNGGTAASEDCEQCTDDTQEYNLACTPPCVPATLMVVAFNVPLVFHGDTGPLVGNTAAKSRSISPDPFPPRAI